MFSPVLPDTLYVNYSLHDVGYDGVTKLVPWVEDTLFFGGQNVMHKFCTDFSEKMIDDLEIVGNENYDLSCATEKLLARCLLNTRIKYLGINDYFDYRGVGWIRPKLAKYFVDCTKSINYHLVEKFYNGEKYAVYFDKIGEKDVVLDPTIII